MKKIISNFISGAALAILGVALITQPSLAATSFPYDTTYADYVYNNSTKITGYVGEGNKELAVDLTGSGQMTTVSNAIQSTPIKNFLGNNMYPFSIDIPSGTNLVVGQKIKILHAAAFGTGYAFYAKVMDYNVQRSADAPVENTVDKVTAGDTHLKGYVSTDYSMLNVKISSASAEGVKPMAINDANGQWYPVNWVLTNQVVNSQNKGMFTYDITLPSTVNLTEGTTITVTPYTAIGDRAGAPIVTTVAALETPTPVTPTDPAAPATPESNGQTVSPATQTAANNATSTQPAVATKLKAPNTGNDAKLGSALPYVAAGLTASMIVFWLAQR